jgi:hypothetical protein
MRLENDAPKSPAVSKRIPNDNVTWVPNLRVETVAIGEIKSAIEIERPPMKAYSRDDALGKVLLER